MPGYRQAAIRRVMLVVAALVATAMLPVAAQAVVVHVKNGQAAGITPIRGVSPATIRSRFGSSTPAPTGFSTSDNLSYHAGPVMHGVSPYLIFWDPGSQISSADKALYERFFADSAADNGLATNIFAVDRQFTDTTGFADYSQSWSSGHAIADTQAYPPAASQCPVATGVTACLYDSQLQAELQRLITADALPDGISGRAPLYFIVSPSTVNTCIDGTHPLACGDNTYCAYHSDFSDSVGHMVLYADMPTILAARDPKGCQYDGNSAVQAPNGSASEQADVVLKAVSHEESETITDPLGTGWYNTPSGQEDGDQCNFYGTYNPSNDTNPNAFTPTLGGSATPSPTYGTLYNQLINSNQYYIQSEWSNGDGNCKMAPTSSAMSAAFSAPISTVTDTPVSFDPSASSSAAAYTSTTWSFGDGTSSFSGNAPATISHTFTSSGVDTVTLTLVDQYGNLATVSHTIKVDAPPVASFSFSPSNPAPGSTVAFDGSGSSEPGGSIVSYSWNFGDGSGSTGPQPVHTYTVPGSYTVALTVTDQDGHTAMTSHSVTVGYPPSASFSFSPSSPVAGSSVAFDGSSSNEPGGSIVAYSWSFGDGATDTVSGARPSHVYGSPGTYTAVLTVTDTRGYTNTTSHAVTVATPPPPPVRGIPTAVISIPTVRPVARVPVSFNGSGSTDSGSKITSYWWSFGDGSASAAANPVHTYARPGRYTVTLTVADATGAQATSTRTATVGSAGITGVKVTTGKLVERIRFTLSGPGLLTVGRMRIGIPSPGTVIYRLKLSQAQRALLAAHHPLQFKLPAGFTPTAGSPSRITIRIKIRP